MKPLVIILISLCFCENLFSQRIITKKSKVIIISLHKVYDRKSSTYDSSASTLQDYKKWTLTKSNILDILKSGKEISGTEMDLSYLVLPFWYKGEFLVNGTKGKYSVNAASLVIIQLNDSSVYLGCGSKKMNKYFLEHPDIN